MAGQLNKVRTCQNLTVYEQVHNDNDSGNNTMGCNGSRPSTMDTIFPRDKVIELNSDVQQRLTVRRELRKILGRLQKAQREVTRGLRKRKREEAKLARELKTQLKEDNLKSARSIAQVIVPTRKAITHYERQLAYLKAKIVEINKLKIEEQVQDALANAEELCPTVFGEEKLEVTEEEIAEAIQALTSKVPSVVSSPQTEDPVILHLQARLDNLRVV